MQQLLAALNAWFTTDVKANFALAISLLSPAIAFFVGFRDRAVLKITSRYYEGWSDGAPHITVSIVNKGRRPIILRMWAGVPADGNWIGEYLGEGKTGLRLGEHDFHEFRLDVEDLYSCTHDGEPVIFEDLFIEDTVGRRHKVPNAKANIAKLNGNQITNIAKFLQP